MQQKAKRYSMLDLVINNARLYPMSHGLELSSYTSIGMSQGKIVVLDSKPQTNAETILDANGQLVLPGFIDCHTHILYAGNRRSEYFKRLAGVSYEDIARQGGGILNTVKAVRDSSTEQLVASSIGRVAALEREGVTTIEVKSGYGLDVASELKMLRAIKALNTRSNARLVATFLGAHAVPPNTTATDYLDLVINKMLPQVAAEQLATSVDVFVENIAFNVAQMTQLFAAATAVGLKVKAHIDQLSNSKGAATAAQLGALSLDHLEYLDQAGIDAMAKNQTVAVLLPGGFLLPERNQATTHLRATSGGRTDGCCQRRKSRVSPYREFIAELTFGLQSFWFNPRGGTAWRNQTCSPGAGF